MKLNCGQRTLLHVHSLPWRNSSEPLWLKNAVKSVCFVHADEWQSWRGQRGQSLPLGELFFSPRGSWERRLWASTQHDANAPWQLWPRQRWRMNGRGGAGGSRGDVFRAGGRRRDRKLGLADLVWRRWERPGREHTGSATLGWCVGALEAVQSESRPAPPSSLTSLPLVWVGEAVSEVEGLKWWSLITAASQSWRLRRG